MKNIVPILLFLSATLLVFSCRLKTEKRRPDTANSTLSSTDSETSVNRSPLMVSNDFGETWNIMSNDLPAEVQTSFLEHKGSKLIVATDNAGIFLSDGANAKWKSIAEALPSNKINAMYVSNDNIYAGVYKNGIHMTNDEGNHWKCINYDLHDMKVQSILKLKNQLLVGNDEGVFTLLDGTKNWLATDIKAQVLSLCEMNGNIVAGTSIGTAISKDDGHSWKWIRRAGAVHYTRHIGERIIELSLNGDVVYSNDLGRTWHMTQYLPRENSYVYEIIEAGDYLIMSNNYGIHRSHDNGKTWKLIYPTESIAFFDLIHHENQIYGGTRTWNEYRQRSN